jgi:hypothetical protein
MDEHSQDRPKAPAGASYSGLAQAIGSRNLLIIIVTMPVVFLVAVMAAISIVGRPGAKEAEPVVEASVLSQPAEFATSQNALADAARSEALAATPAAAAVAAQSAPLVLPRGATIGAMALDGDRLALRVEGENGGEIVIYDLARGATIQRITVTPQQSATPDEGL